MARIRNSGEMFVLSLIVFLVAAVPTVFGPVAARNFFAGNFAIAMLIACGSVLVGVLVLYLGFILIGLNR
jgi:hypothetical protein